MEFLNTAIQPLGMGCWPIGGKMCSGGKAVGYANADDATSVRTIHAALDAGITLFDTAAAYGAGHAERLLGQALNDRPEAIIITKIGTAIDEDSKQLLHNEDTADTVLPAIEAALTRLNRDCVDVVLLHLNALPLEQADPLFAKMDEARHSGKIRAYGWSTDFCASANAVADQDGFVAVEYAMNVLQDAPRMVDVCAQTGLAGLIRSPLGMGLLSGKYNAQTVMPEGDIRATNNARTAYFKDAGANPGFLAQLDAIRGLLTTGGRSPVQGALGWLWAKSDMAVPIPGARTVEQIEGLAGALAYGALPGDVMTQIEQVLDRGPDDPEDRAR